MSKREYDESDARVRPARSTRRRTKDRPAHEDAIFSLVTAVDRGRTTCITDDGVIVTAMKARELGPKSVVVGDRVGLVGDVSGKTDSLARIVTITERRNSLSRTVDDAAKVERTIVANIDQLVIVVAATNPPPRRGLIDRFLVSAFNEGIAPVILVTKTDLGQIPEFMEEYKTLGVKILTTAIKTESKEADLQRLHEMLTGKISVLVGHSGVGKSTLINTLSPEFRRETGEVNEVTGRGRHTSSSAIAFKLATGGWVIDTPGVRSFGLSHVSRVEIIAAFPDLNEVVTDCQKNCSHDEDECKLNIWQVESSDEVENLERTGRVANLRRILASLDEN